MDYENAVKEGFCYGWGAACAEVVKRIQEHYHIQIDTQKFIDAVAADPMVQEFFHEGFFDTSGDIVDDVPF